MKISKDPTREELETFCDSHRESFDRMSDNEWEFSKQSAIHYFATLNHDGQWSNLYSALSTSEYKPGRLENFDSWCEEDFVGAELFGRMWT